ncbi:unnamed protein product [Blepharisma stoltei]|uniref:Uncharacterized protein n=1 Tax=Blepharisma stoltei TaxID=1481888 RepID=A0AAU9IQ93_9CILI|nr:unnamed protein product [Blepharisma stoltei]
MNQSKSDTAIFFTNSNSNEIIKEIDIDIDIYHAKVTFSKVNSNCKCNLDCLDWMEDYINQMTSSFNAFMELKNRNCNSHNSFLSENTTNRSLNSSYESSLSSSDTFYSEEEQKLSNEWKKLIKEKAIFQKQNRQLIHAKKEIYRSVKALLQELISTKLGIENQDGIFLFPLCENKKMSTFFNISERTSLDHSIPKQNAISSSLNLQDKADASASIGFENIHNSSCFSSKEDEKCIHPLIKESIISESNKNKESEKKAKIRKQNRWITVPNIEKLIKQAPKKLTLIEKEKNELEEKAKSIFRKSTEINLKEFHLKLKEQEIAKKLEYCDLKQKENSINSEKIARLLKSYINHI